MPVPLSRRKSAAREETVIKFLRILQKYYPEIIQSPFKKPIWKKVLIECQSNGLYSNKNEAFLQRTIWPNHKRTTFKKWQSNGTLTEKDELVIAIERNNRNNFCQSPSIEEPNVNDNGLLDDTLPPPSNFGDDEDEEVEFEDGDANDSFVDDDFFDASSEPTMNETIPLPSNDNTSTCESNESVSSLAVNNADERLNGGDYVNQPEEPLLININEPPIQDILHQQQMQPSLLSPQPNVGQSLLDELYRAQIRYLNIMSEKTQLKIQILRRRIPNEHDAVSQTTNDNGK